MGRLQGPHGIEGLPGATAPSAGFATLTSNAYYQYMLYTKPGDAVAFTVMPTFRRARVIRSIAAQHGTMALNPHRYASWYWASGLTEANREAYVIPIYS